MLDKEELKNNIVFHKEPLIPDLSYFNNEVPKIKQYLIGMAPSHAYRARKRGTTVEKARDDDECGKISEVFVDRFLNETYGFPGGGVDYTIKDYRNKNWDPDLCYPGYSDFKFAVKSCFCKYTHNNIKQYSWVFGTGNKDKSGGVDPIVHPNSTEICFFVVNRHFKSMGISSNVGIFASAPVYLIYDIFKDPFCRKHIGSKKCIYYNDLFSLPGLDKPKTHS
jgi:hypothetical protein